MHFSSIAHVIGILLVVTGGSMGLPVMWSLYYGEGDLTALMVSAMITIALGLSLLSFFRRHQELGIKDAIVIASLGWVIVSALSGLPFIIHGSIPSFTDAFFEMMSGYTTTGATILKNIEAVPHGLLFWRSETHLLGGMGFLTLVVIFLPHGMGGLRIARAESSPGQVITKDKFKARNKDTMIWLWGIYLGLNVLETILLCMGGMSLFDSLCHAFGTISTGGYSPQNLSVGAYKSAYLDWVITIFMFLGGMSFLLFYRMMMGDFRSTLINTEFRWYVGIMVFFCGATALILWQANTYPSLMESVRYATFQVTSLLTTTGFTTADYEQWPQAAQMFLYAVCFIGACAGSTTSGIKVVHYVIICKFIYLAIKKLLVQPMTVKTIQLNRRPIDASIVDLAICYFIVNIFMILAGGCFMALVEKMDFTSAMSSIIATLMNIGPGFGIVGPTKNYAQISDVGKWFLSWNMLVGRLEMFSALVILLPAFWRK
ncbi:MAG: TrkH family potassium uptake protein [Proteobacteria bacterium]|nr:TrkH family potassium uptake protein [Pseudomonadota bacterium]